MFWTASSACTDSGGHSDKWLYALFVAYEIFWMAWCWFVVVGADTFRPGVHQTKSNFFFESGLPIVCFDTPAPFHPPKLKWKKYDEICFTLHTAKICKKVYPMTFKYIENLISAKSNHYHCQLEWTKPGLAQNGTTWQPPLFNSFAPFLLRILARLGS